MTQDDRRDPSKIIDRAVTPFIDPFPPRSSTTQITFGAQSSQGSLHGVNEDHYLIVELGRSQRTVLTSLPETVIAKGFDEHGFAMVVADGIGEHGEGEAASRLAIATLMHLVLHFGKWNLRIDDTVAREVMDRAERFYRHIDTAVVHQGRTGVRRPFQTSLTAVFGAGEDLFFAHVGHSRAYLFRRGALLRLTRDHTMNRHRSPKVMMAPMVDVNAAARDLKHILTDAIGMSGSLGPQIDLERFRVADQDRVLVCTNGLTDAVDEHLIADVLTSAGTAEDHCRTLIDLARKKVAEDDVTALIAQFSHPEEREP